MAFGLAEELFLLTKEDGCFSISSGMDQNGTKWKYLMAQLKQKCKLCWGNSAMSGMNLNAHWGLLSGFQWQYTGRT